MSDTTLALPAGGPGPFVEGAVPLVDRLRLALVEDLGTGDAGDVTSRALVPQEHAAGGVFLAKADGVLCGMHLLPLVFQTAEGLVAGAPRGAAPASRPSAAKPTFELTVLKPDGARVAAGDVVARFAGMARALLVGERTALNLLGRLSGIATQTRRYVDAVAGTRTRILSTRKTTPLWRDLEKHAIRCGGGVNHRLGLFDMVLIKDNHLALWGTRDPAEAVRAAKARFPCLAVEVEVTDLEGLERVCRWSVPEYVLLDNFDVVQVAQAVMWCNEFFRGLPCRPMLEASGGITLENVRSYAETGVERISIGALTHSVRALDLSLELMV